MTDISVSSKSGLNVQFSFYKACNG